MKEARFSESAHVADDGTTVSHHSPEATTAALQLEEQIKPAPQTSERRAGKKADETWRKTARIANPTAVVVVSADGKVSLHAMTGKAQDLDALEATIRKTVAFKETSKRLKESLPDLVAKAVKANGQQLQQLISVHEQSPDVLAPVAFEEALENLTFEEIEPDPFQEAKPTRKDVQVLVSNEADEQVSTFAFWKLKELREMYFNEHYWDRYYEEIAAWEKRKAAFERDEANRIARENDRIRALYEKDVAALASALNGDAAYVHGVILRWAEELKLPIAFELNYEFDRKAHVLHLDVACPDDTELPSYDLTQTRAGFLKVKQLSDAVVRKRYAAWLFSNLVFLAANAFNASPQIREIWLTASAPRVDDLGHVVQEPIISSRCPRDAFYGLDYSEVDPEKLLLAFEHQCKLSMGKAFKPVQAY